MEYDEFLAALSKILEEKKRPYYVTGGFAVSVWGRPRATFDIDIVMMIRGEDVPTVASALRTLGKDMYVDEQMMKAEIRKQGEFNIIHPESGLKVDFWVLKEDAFSKSCLARRVAKVIRGQKVYFISPEDLVLSKLQWYARTESSRHLEDVESVFKIFGEQLDRKYLKEWAKKLGVLETLNQFT